MAVRITAKVQATVPQLVRCVHCDCEFVYEMTVTGAASAEIGMFDNEARARADVEAVARESLASRLANPMLCEAIPCRKCFRYQPYMRRMLATGRYDGLGCCLAYPIIAIGAFVTILAAVAWFTAPKTRDKSMWVFLSAIAATFIGSFILKCARWLTVRYDPDKQPLAERQKLAAERTITLAAFNIQQEKRVAETYREYVFTVLHGGARGGNPFAEVQQLVVEWWAPPAMFSTGGAIPIRLGGTDHVTVLVPDDAKPGDLFYPRRDTPNVTPFAVRLVPIRVHPDEQRLE